MVTKLCNFDSLGALFWRQQSYVVGMYYVPLTEGERGHIAFSADPVGVGVRLAHCLHSLLNQWVDFDQTCTDTLLGGRKEVIRFWGP